MRVRILWAASVLWLAGCAQDPLAEHSVYWGLSPFERPTGPLVRVLDTDSDAPAKQGLLYTSMRDAEVAATYAGRALARLDEPGETESAIGEVVYAIAPAEAPAWDARDGGFVPGWPSHAFGIVPSRGYGVVPGWASHGYGLQRALDGMTEEIAGATEPGSAAALHQRGPRALTCIENTEDRTGQILALSQQMLAGGGGIDPEPTLRQIKELAVALNRGVPAPGERGCGLQEVERELDQVVTTGGAG